MTEERRKRERRKWGKTPEYPFRDSDGNLVTHNRRRIIDRRSSDVDLRESLGEHLRLKYQDKEFVVSFDAPPFTVGRSKEADLQIDESFVSRLHATIECRHGEFFLKDQSRNGTLIKGEDGGVTRLAKSETVLQGEGVISFGERFEHNEGHLVEYRLG
ncbi:MAG: FHA domain-containing protein [Gammaproteobacteria bacterium]